MTYYSRSAWTNTSKSAVKLAGTGRTQKYIYIHYPGSPGTVGRESTSSTKRRLKGYLTLHTRGRGWSDIAYNLAVDQSGNVWELRGVDRQCGANGGTSSNRSGQAILVLVGNDEKPTAECVSGIEDAIARIQSEHSTAKTIRGHRDSPDASTACPGPHLTALVRSGDLEGKSKPSKPAPKPTKEPGETLDVDGRWGANTTAALQSWVGVEVDGRAGEDTWSGLQRKLKAPYVDGIISRQSHKAEDLGNGIVPGKTWDYTGPGSEGSQTVELLQKLLKVKADGVVGPKTTKALQKFLNKELG